MRFAFVLIILASSITTQSKFDLT